MTSVAIFVHFAYIVFIVINITIESGYELSSREEYREFIEEMYATTPFVLLILHNSPSMLFSIWSAIAVAYFSPLATLPHKP